MTLKLCFTINSLFYFSSDTYDVLSSSLSREWVNSVGARLDLPAHPFRPPGRLSKTTFSVVNFTETDIETNGKSHRRDVKKLKHNFFQYFSSYGYFYPHPPSFTCTKGPRCALIPAHSPPSATNTIFDFIGQSTIHMTRKIASNMSKLLQTCSSRRTPIAALLSMSTTIHFSSVVAFGVAGGGADMFSSSLSQFCHSI